MTEYQSIIRIINNLQFKQRLDQALVKLFSKYSRSQIKKWIINGQVEVNGQIIYIPKTKVCGGEQIKIQASLEIKQFWIAQNISLNIVYEDADIIVINKPRNLVVHPGSGNTHGTLLNALLYYYPPISKIPRAGIVHRLDKDTTGLMIVAKTISAQIKLTENLKSHSIIREYEAITIGTIITGGIIHQPISRHSTKRTRMTVNPMGKPAITYYHVIENFRSHTHLRLQLKTGRTHQIRVHMEYIHHPLVGDNIYGKFPVTSLEKEIKTSCEVLRCFNRPALHAITLRVSHPITFVTMEWNAPLPKDMIDLINELKNDTNLSKNKMSINKIY